MAKNDLPITEEIDLHYLLTLMPPLTSIKEYAWLPELFSIVGHESLLKLSRYAGGETIRIPTLSELELAIDSLQTFYDIYIAKRREVGSIHPSQLQMVSKIKEVYDARNSKEDNI